ncbi:MAG: hypothetical protein IPO68_11605 [Chitinophagaceae bacterium]|nr:hypothetical protein [Chitinophagaceae bacterium]
MLKEESVWIGKELLKLAEEGSASPILNFGSSTGHFRKTEQPIIHTNIFEPLEKSAIKVYHLDIKLEEGVDFVGNVFEDKALFNEIRSKNIKCILCSNLLEHVPDPKPFYSILEQLIDGKGYILVTVPFLYPYHADPIDTKYRPTVNDVVQSFSNARLVKGETITINETHFQFIKKHPSLFFIILFRVFTPFYRFKTWKKIISDIPNLFKKFRVTCVLVEISK